jgi:hypothetical protein
MTAVPDASERARRSEVIKEAKAACLNDETIDKRTKRREDRADQWALWLRNKMNDAGCADPSELLPDVLAKIDLMIDDRVAAATRELKATLVKALK